MAKNNNLTDFLTDLADKIRAGGKVAGTVNPQNFSKFMYSKFPSLIDGLSNISLTADDLFNVTAIRDYAFYNFTKLQSIEIPSGISSIGSNAFYNCSGLTSVTIPDSVTSIGSSAFSGCSGLTSITIPNSVMSIGNEVFYNCSGMTSVTIGNGVTSIGRSAFSGCSGLTGLYISDLSAWCKIKFGSYDANPLYYAKKLYLNNELVTNLVIPYSVTSINNYAFYYCSGLTSVTIPDSVTSIGSYAFYGCSGLTNITLLPTTPPTLGINAFLNNTLTQIIVPVGYGETYRTADGWTDFANYIVEEGRHRVILGEEVTCSVAGTEYFNQIFDVDDQAVIHFEVGQSSGGGAVSSTPDGIFLNGVLVSEDSEPATYDLTVTGNVSVTYSNGETIDGTTYNNCYKIVMD